MTFLILLNYYISLDMLLRKPKYSFWKLYQNVIIYGNLVRLVISWKIINYPSILKTTWIFGFSHLTENKLSTELKLDIENVALERVEKFNCLGVILQLNMTWK